MGISKTIYERNMAARQAKQNQKQNQTNAVNTAKSITSTNTNSGLTTYKDKLNNLYNEISNRKFNYDQANDNLYQQYADMYTKNAKLAMQDTVGQAASLTGGYANSYAETAGQAMYNQNMAQLNEKALELEQMAENQYNNETNRLMNLYGLAQDEYNTAYQESRDAVADNQWAQEFSESQRQYDTNLAYNQSRDAVADNQWAQEFSENKRQYDADNEYNYNRLAEDKRQYDADYEYKMKSRDDANSQFDKELAYKYATEGFVQDKNGKWVTATSQDSTNFSKSMKQFTASIMTPTEFAKRPDNYTAYGQTFDTYLDYVEAALKNETAKGNISTDDAKRLIVYYGIE